MTGYVQKKLTLNLRKTKYLIFQPRQKVDYNLLPLLSIAGQFLEQVSKIKYLDIYIDSLAPIPAWSYRLCLW